jgi:hypothetical protein
MHGICLTDYLHQQQQEALGPVNKWYCSQYYGYEINDPEKLLSYYIKHGGASHFCQEHTLDPTQAHSSSHQP